MNSRPFLFLLLFASLFLPPSAAAVGHVSNVTPSRSFANNQPDSQFGFSVATAGDVNSDGYADVIIGAPYYTHDQSEEGIAVAYYGRP